MRFIQINDTQRVNPRFVTAVMQPADGPPKVHVMAVTQALTANHWVDHANALSTAIYNAPWTLDEQFPPPPEPE